MVSSTDIQTEVDNDVINGIPVELTGEAPLFATDTFEISADITTGGNIQDINVALVIDTSGSSNNSSGSDVDGDGTIDTFLDAQKAAANALFDNLVAAGYNPADVTISLIEYSGSASTVGDFTLNDETAFKNAVDGLTGSGATNFDDALDQVISDWRGTTTDGTADDNPESEVTENDTNLVIFLSDGVPTVGGTNFTNELNILDNEFDADITAIGLGANSDLTQLEVIDNTGSATQLTDISQLNALINAPPPLPDLQQIDIVVDGVVLATYPANDPAIIQTALGYRLDCVEIMGYPYTIGDSLDVEIVATFTPGGDQLSVDFLSLPMFVCFVSGTRILTPEGPVAIEGLEVGSRVITRDHGIQRLRWIGSTKLPKHALMRRPELRPVRITAGSLGNDLPEHDLCVSRQHRVLVRDWRAEMLFGSPEGVLTPAFTLMNDFTIRMDDVSEDGVEYFHMAFDGHEVVYSEGVETESFHPAADTVSVLTEPQRQELYALFPELESGVSSMTAARVGLKGRDGKALRMLPSR